MPPPASIAGTVEQALLEDPRVQDCCVTGEGEAAVAWVVPRRPVRTDALATLLRERVGAGAPEVALLDAIPRDASGGPDLARLSRLSPATPARLRQLEARFREAGSEAVALVGARDESAHFDPLDALLPEPLLPLGGAPSSVQGAAAQSSAAAGAGGTSSGRLSLSDGGPLIPPPGAPETLGGTLRRAAELYPERTVTCIDAEGGREVLRYADLWQQALRLAAGLAARGVAPGEQVLLLLERPADLLRAFWGCVLAGAVPAPAASLPSFERTRPAVEKFLAISERLGNPLVLVDARAEAPLAALGLRVTVPSAWETPEPRPPVEVAPSALTLLTFTSGSTGNPKGVVVTHTNLLSMCDAVVAGGWFTAEDVCLIWMPLDHLAGLAMFSHLTAVRTCTSNIMVSREYVLADLLRWMDLMSEFGATVSWAPNFAFGLVAERIERGERRPWDLSRVRVMACAGEPLVAETLRRFTAPLAQDGLRQDVICPVWGMSETSSAFTAMRGVRAGPDGAVECGPAVAGAMLRVVDDQDALVPEGVTGHLQAKGISVMPGYLEDGDLNARSFTKDGWFRTGDLAIIRDGVMIIAGRQKEIIIINGAHVYPHDVEAVVEQVQGVLPAHAVACPTRAFGAATESLLIFFVPEPDAPPLPVLMRSIREHVGRVMGLQVGWLVPLKAHQVPRMGLGKLGRTELRKSFESGVLAAERRVGERVLGGPSTLPRCLAVPREVPVPAVRAGRTALRSPVLLVGGEGLATALLGELAGREVVRVAPGDGGVLARALKALASRGQGGLDVVYAPDQEGASSRLERGALVEAVAPVLQLVQALAAPAATTPVRLMAALPRPGSALGGEAAGLLVPGLLRSAAAEVPGLEARVVWVPAGAEAAACVAEELDGLRAAHEVHWRDGQRWELTHEPWVPLPVEAPRRLKRQGLYLITGALGGVGRAWARFLRQGLEARLLLVGRRPRGEEAEALERELGDALYLPVDVTDAAALREAVRQAEARFGQACDGAFHFASTRKAILLEQETPERLVQDTAAQVLGAVAVAEALRERPEALLVFASSLMGTLGAARFTGYCAASTFVTRLAERLAAEGRRAVAVTLGAVRDTGLSRGAGAAAPGYRTLEPSQALAAIALAVESGHAHMLAGVAGAAWPWRAAGLGTGEPLEQAHLFFVPPPGGAARMVDVADEAVLHPLLSLPRRADGAVDREALAARVSGGAEGPPQGPLEAVVVEAFREVLGADVPGRLTDFFSLGGSSLQATRVMARINARTGLRLREATLFDHPSASRLAAHLQQAVDLKAVDVSQLSDDQVALLLSALQPS
jgi:acyl-CoA synthetase (AMP-forming)/AMP-acid ligase II/NAD(P)-dependent dehydrogenase (short-subunit alcohol dehydrogenase family)